MSPEERLRRHKNAATPDLSTENRSPLLGAQVVNSNGKLEIDKDNLRLSPQLPLESVMRPLNVEDESGEIA